MAGLLDRRWRDWLAKSWQDSARTIIVIVGVALVAVPTAFGAFPYLVALWITWRALIGLAWLTVAVIAVRLAAKSDDAVRDAVKASNNRSLLAEHRNKLRDQLESLFVSGTGGLPESYRLTLYGPSPNGMFLIPLYPPALGLADPAIFAASTGAVGAAWSDPGSIVVVKGDAVWNADHGLTVAQSRRFRPYKVIAATAVMGSSDEPLGVIAAMTRTNDATFDDEHGADLLESLAQTIAWLVPEAVRWMMLREDETA